MPFNTKTGTSAELTSNYNKTSVQTHKSKQINYSTLNDTQFTSIWACVEHEASIDDYFY